MVFIANLLGWLIQLLTLLVVVNALLSFFLSPYHPLRETLDRLINPFLNPIRRVLPPIGGLDFSPFVLIILLQLVERLLVRLLYSLA